MAIDNIIGTNILIGIIVWCVVYISDYTLTLIGARLHARYTSQHVNFGGSYELNPVFQKDVDRRRWISPRFVLFLTMTTGYLVLVAIFLRGSDLFAFALGALLLLEVPVHYRHFQNVRLGLMLRQDATLAQGQITYKRALSYRLIVLDFIFFCVLWLILALLSGSFFFLGGVFGSLITALRFYRVGIRVQRAEARLATAAPETNTL